MSTTTSKTIPSFLSGALFGGALTASRVYIPSVITGQLRLRDFHMLSVFLTASASSAAVILLFETLGISARKIRSNSTLGWFSPYDANILGGALIGVGMALTGACPGTVVAQLGNGVSSSGYVAMGAIGGGAFFAKYGKDIIASESTTEPVRRETIAGKVGVDATKIFLAFEVMCAAAVSAVVFLQQRGPYVWIHPVIGGLLIGAAQAVSIVLTDTPLGTSGAYEQIGRYLWRAIGAKDVALPPSPPQSLIFGLGILAGSAALGRYMPFVPVNNVNVDKLSAVIGGFLMILGARAAGGCTSGHGISGLSAFSFSSLITVAAMFGGGILTALMLT